MSVSNPQESPTPTSLREQIAEILVKWNMPTRQSAISDIMRAVTTYIEDIQLNGIADRAVVDNIKLVVDSQIPTEWTNPVTGAKVFNQAFIEAAEIDARINSYQDGLITGAMPEVIGKPMAEDYLKILQAQKAVLEEKS